MTQVIENASSQKDTVISALYSSLNKVILYSLSKPHQSLSECLSLLRILGFLQEHWDIVFATYNSNASFLMCFMHCLLLLSARRLELPSSNPSIWQRDLQNPKGLYPRNFNNGHSHTLVFFHILVSHFWFNPQTCSVSSAWLGDGPREEGTWTWTVPRILEHVAHWEPKMWTAAPYLEPAIWCVGFQQNINRVLVQKLLRILRLRQQSPSMGPFWVRPIHNCMSHRPMKLALASFPWD